MNHDGTSGTVDLINSGVLSDGNIMYADVEDGSLYYKGSNLDTYLESTIYNGFPNIIKNSLDNMNVISGKETIQRHVVAPSLMELGNTYYLNCDDSAILKQEGNMYPIYAPACFPNTKNGNGVPFNRSYWTRSCSKYTFAIRITRDGKCIGNYPSMSAHCKARSRFAKK